VRSKCQLSWLLVLGLLLGVTHTTRSAAEEARDKALPSDLALVPQQAVGLGSVRVADLWQHEAVARLQRKKGKELKAVLSPVENVLGVSSLADIERFTMVVTLDERSQPLSLFFVKTLKPYDRDKLLEALGPTRRTVEVGDREYHVGRGYAVHLIDRQTFVLAPAAEEGIRKLLDDPKSREAGPLGKALALAAGKHSVVLALNPGAFPDEVRNNWPEKEAQFRPLIDMHLGMLVLDLDKQVRGQLQLAFPDEGKATKGVPAVKALLLLTQGGLEQTSQRLSKRPRDIRNFTTMLNLAQGMLKEAKVQQKGEVVGVELAAEVDRDSVVGAIVESIREVQLAAARMQSSNNLKQIGLAMHNYHDVNGSFPPAAIYSAEGKPLLSWRVLVLPYLGRNDLYQQFKLDEPWDSKHNKKLLAKMPAVFKPTVAGKAKPYHTFLQVLVGKGTVFEGKRGIQIRQIIDGTSNTIMVVEGSKAVPWTKPQDIPFDPTKAPPRLGGIFPDGFNATFCDGSVHFIRNTIKPATLRLLIQRNDGMPVPRDLD
jgi:hypothetical protein